MLLQFTPATLTGLEQLFPSAVDVVMPSDVPDVPERVHPLIRGPGLSPAQIDCPFIL